jgi:two-component system response regulator CpxR
MRPKKVIVVAVDRAMEENDRNAAAALRYLLKINHFRVLPAAMGHEAALLAATQAVLDMGVALCSTAAAGETQAQCWKRIRPQMPVLLLVADKKAESAETATADAALLLRTKNMAELLERVKVMSARKPGPRKASHPFLDVGAVGAV